MPKNRIVPAVAVALMLPFWAWAQQPTPPANPAQTAASKGPETPPTEAETKLDAAIEKVKALKSVTATIREDVKMLGIKFRVEGQYMRAPEWRVALRLDVTGLADIEGRMLQISDGRTFWDVREVLGARELRKRELGPIMERLSGLEPGDELRDTVISLLGLSGPEALLVGLRAAISFDQMEENELDGRKVWVLRGRWSDRARLTGPNQPALPAAGPLPPFVPSLAVVWLDQENGWPHRVELTGRAPSILETKQDLREIGPDGRPAGRPVTPPKVDPSEIVLVYKDLVLNPSIDPAQFIYNPPTGQGVQILDETQAITANLTSALAERAARMRAEAAKEAPADLPRTIPVPAPPGDALRPPDAKPVARP